MKRNPPEHNEDDTIDNIFKEIDNINSQHETNQNFIDQLFDRLKSNIDFKAEELHEDRVDLINSIYAFQKLSLYYEDLSNDDEDKMNCSLMTTAYNELSVPANEYRHFVRFLSRHKRSILSYEGVAQYIQRLQNKVTRLNDYIVNSKLGNDLDLNFIK